MGQTGAGSTVREDALVPGRTNQIGIIMLSAWATTRAKTIIFGLLGETLEITVKATSRYCYAQAPWPPPSSSSANPRMYA